MTTIIERSLTVEEARWAVQHATKAPSVHNSQPWRFRFDGSAFELRADTTRGLSVIDPDGRELVISCGAALFNLRLALRKLGFDACVVPLPDERDPRPLARVTRREGRQPDPDERRAFAASLRRHTCRGGFEERPLHNDLLVGLQRAATLEGAELVDLTHPGQRRRILHLARAAEREQRADERYRAEVHAWTSVVENPRRDGVPALAFPVQPMPGPDDLAGRDFDLGRRIGRLDAPAPADGVVAVLATPRDLEGDWLAAGQALQRLLVQAAESSVFAAMHSQISEVHHYRSELQREMYSTGWPQLLLRLGYVDGAIPESPRRPIGEVLEVTGTARAGRSAE